MDPEALLQGLDAAQLEAVSTSAAPLGILAGAGSGKTRVLTRRIAYRVATGTTDASHVLAVTFTRRAAAELRTRLFRLGVRDRVTAGTFHGVAWSVVRQRAIDRGEALATLVADRSRLVTSVLGDVRGGGRGGGRRPSVAEVVGEIDWAKARGIGPDGYAEEAARHGRHPPAGIGAVAVCFAAYETARRRARSLDFDDLLAVCTAALERDRPFAEAQRWRFRSLFVDEFQDVSPRQFALLEAWRGGRDDVCVVGDPHQAIYAWNGADPSLLRELPAHLPGATIVRLRANYRSTPQVLSVAETVLSSRSPPRRGRASSPPAVGFEPAVRAGADGPVPEVLAFADEQAEAAGIARVLSASRPLGGRWSHAAVLVRTHAQLGPIERALADAGIPRRGGMRRLSDHPLVRDVLATMEGTRTQPGGLGDLRDELHARLAPLEPEDGPLDESDRRALEDLLAMVRDELIADPRAPVSVLSATLNGGERPGTGRGADGVDLVTFHAAKGLEWPVVIVAGVEDGFVPLHGTRNEARDEEARLLYVALTRARQRLVVTRAVARHRGTELVARAPSPWLVGIEAACAELRRPPAPDDVEALLVSARSQLAAPSSTKDPMPALRAWRTRAARAAQVPEVAVCGDDVLVAIARRRPADEGELADVPGVGPLLARRHGSAVLAALSGV